MKIAQFARNVVWEVWLPVVLLALWWVLSANSTSFYFPSLEKIAAAFADNWLFERVGTDLLPSLERLAYGYGFALVAGIAVGLLFGVSKVASAMFEPVLDFLRSMPSVAVIPIMVLLFGLDNDMKVATLAFVGFFPIMLNTMDGARSVDTQLRDVAAGYRIGFKDRIFSIFLPAAAPQIFAGARIALSLCIMALALAEMIGTPGGLGSAVLQAQRAFDIPAMWAGILMFGILGYVMNRLFLLVEKRVLAWHRGMTALER